MLWQSLSLGVPVPWRVNEAELFHKPSRFRTMRDTKTILIVVLAAAVAVLGFLYWDSQQTRLTIDVPGVKLDAR